MNSVDRADKINHIVRNRLVCIQGVLKKLEMELSLMRQQLSAVERELADCEKWDRDGTE